MTLYLLEDGDGLLDESVAGELSSEVQFGVPLEDGREYAEQLDDQRLVRKVPSVFSSSKTRNITC